MKIKYEGQFRTRRDSTREKTFTNKINYVLNKIPENLAKEPNETQDKRLNTYQTNNGIWKRHKPYMYSSQVIN
jgi:hypothetical protein